MTITGGSSLRKSRHMTQSTCDYMAVVPIFVNAGSAILPAIAAPIVSGLALLLKPRELVAVCRSRPLGTIVTILLLAILVAGGVWLLHGTSASARARPTEHPLRNELKIDWHQEALRILNGEQPLGLNATFAPGTKATHDGPAVFRGDYARCGHDGGPAPMQLRPSWTFNPDDDTLYLSSPIVVGERVYAAACILDLSKPSQFVGSVFCLNASDGKPRWRLESAPAKSDPNIRESFKGFFSSPAITADGKYLIIGQGLHEDADS